MNNDNKLYDIIAQSGVKKNKYGGMYTNGQSFSKQKWIEIISVYYKYINEHNKAPSIRQFAKIASISIGSAKKTIGFIQDGSVSVSKKGHGKTGVGSIMNLLPEEETKLLMLRKENPSRPNASYVVELFKFSDRVVSESFISQWFLKAGPHRGSCQKTSTFPTHRYSMTNVMLLYDYQEHITNLTKFDPSRIKFCDEKSLKGIHIYGHSVRADPLTGKKEPVSVDNSILRTAVNIFTACSIDPTVNPVEYFIGEFEGSSIVFFEFVAYLIEVGFLKPYDTLVGDNAKIHASGYCEDLANILWDEFNILWLPLPPYVPELNPTEEVFRTTVVRLRSMSCRMQVKSVPELTGVAAHVLNGITRDNVAGYYKNSGIPAY